MQDKTLSCQDCGKDFVFTANEQVFYQEHQFQHEPKRCNECRAAKKQRFGNSKSRPRYDRENQ